MRNLIVFYALFVVSSACLACEQVKDPSRECWNPPDEHVDAGLRRFYRVEDDIDDALFINDKKAVVRLANEYLSAGKIYRNNWNYGNAIHNANVALGVVALREGHVKRSATYLIEAGKTPGSPQLDSFGPELDLASALLQAGESTAVIGYLKLISRFWEGEREVVAAVVGEIESGKRPRLDRFSLSHEDEQ